MNIESNQPLPVSRQLVANIDDPSRISASRMLDSVLKHETTVKIALVAGLVGSLATGLALNADGFRPYDNQKIDTVTPVVNAMSSPADAHLDRGLPVSGSVNPVEQQAKH